MKKRMELSKLNSGDYSCGEHYGHLRRLLAIGKPLWLDKEGRVTDINNKLIAWIKGEVII